MEQTALPVPSNSPSSPAFRGEEGVSPWQEEGKEVSREGQDGAREKPPQRGARWGEQGKGRGALRPRRGWGVGRRACECSQEAGERCSAASRGRLPGTGKSQTK